VEEVSEGFARSEPGQPAVFVHADDQGCRVVLAGQLDQHVRHRRFVGRCQGIGLQPGLPGELGALFRKLLGLIGGRSFYLEGIAEVQDASRLLKRPRLGEGGFLETPSGCPDEYNERGLRREKGASLLHGLHGGGRAVKTDDHGACMHKLKNNARESADAPRRP
jgi:hypothetical protein